MVRNFTINTEVFATTPEWGYCVFAGKKDIILAMRNAIKTNVLVLLGMVAVMSSPAVVLTGDDVEVVVSATARGSRLSTWFAAEEMTNFLSRVLARQVPIAHAPSPAKVSVVLGTNEWSEAAGVDVQSLPRDAAVIQSRGSCVFIAGVDGAGFRPDRRKPTINVERGTLNGVYEFLERFAGCRFYFPGELGEIVPRRESILVPEGRLVTRPDFIVRESTASLGEWPEEYAASERERMGLLFMLRMRYQTRKIPCCHGQFHSGFCKRFGKTHPEYFRLTEKGVRHIGDPLNDKVPDKWSRTSVCNSSGIWDEIYADARSYFLGEGPEVRGVLVQRGEKGFEWGPQARYREYYDVMPNDGMHKCFCDKCQAAYARAKDPSNYANELVWGRVADLGRRLKAEGVKGTITMMSYVPYRNVPDVELPDNVAVMVCTGGPWMRGQVSERSMETLRSWSENRKGKVWLWHNTGRYGAMVSRSVDVPSPTPRAFGRHYKEIAPLALGAYCSNNSPRFLYSAMNYYVFYKVAWDNAVDVDALVDEYHRLMFGPAAAPMGRFLDSLERKWMEEVMGNVEDTPLGEMAVPPSEFRFWSQIYTLGFVKELDALVREAERLVAPGSLEARRVALFRREYLAPMFAHAESYDGGGSVRRELDRRAAARRPSVAGGTGEAVIDVRADMTNSVNHKVRFPVSLSPGRRYRISYFVRCHDVRLVHRWGGVGACVWEDESRDRALAVTGQGLCGTFDWICQSAEFDVPQDIEPAAFKPKLDVRVSRAVGKAEFKGLLVEDVGAARSVRGKEK